MVQVDTQFVNGQLLIENALHSFSIISFVLTLLCGHCKQKCPSKNYPDVSCFGYFLLQMGPIHCSGNSPLKASDTYVPKQTRSCT